MDRHVLWLRRFLVSRIALRVVTEGAVVALLVMVGAGIAGLDVVVVAIAGFFCFQLFAAVRVGSAIVMNPVNYRYLMRWDDTSHLLHPVEDAEPPRGPSATTLTETGFEYMIGLKRSDSESAFNLYRAPSRAVLVADGAGGEPPVVLSRLTDRRLVVTASELVPPHQSVVVNQDRNSELVELIRSHVAMLGDLRDRDLHVAEIGPEAILDQLHFEWDAWNQIGPYLGPLLSASNHRQPLLLQARLPREMLWERTAAPLPPLYAPPIPPTNEPAEPKPLAGASS